LGFFLIVVVVVVVITEVKCGMADSCFIMFN